MVSFDIRTIILIFIVTSSICLVFVTALWLQNRSYFRGIGYWAADFLIQSGGFILLFLRGYVPDYFSFVAGNLLILGGFILLIRGLELFYGLATHLKFNIILLFALSLILYYFSSVVASLQVRSIAFSVAAVIVATQGSFLIFRRIQSAKKIYSKSIGYIFAAFMVFSFIRFVLAMIWVQNNDFMKGINPFDTMFLIFYQILFIAIAISLAQIVHERYRYEVGENAEEKVRIREAYLRSIIETLPGRIWLKDLEGHFLTVNTPFAKAFGFNRPEELSGLTDFDICPEPVASHFMNSDREVMNSGTPSIIEEVCPICKEELWFETYKTPIFDSNRRLWGTAGYSRDITRRKKIENDLITAKERAEENEKAIQLGLNEKEMLLRELYHRTKNNMQVIQSIIQLRALISDNEAIKDFAREIEQKILSMALVHQKLYQSKDLSHIQLHDYLEELTELMLKSFNSEFRRIGVGFTMKPVTVLIDIAIPCGLVANELLTNAFKYAINDSSETQIDIELFRDSEGCICLNICDNGKGFAPEFDISKQKNLGLQTVFELIEKQLRGSIVYESSEKGLKYTIRFSDALYNQRV